MGILRLRVLMGSAHCTARIDQPAVAGPPMAAAPITLH
jgi:hypothetical protein